MPPAAISPSGSESQHSGTTSTRAGSGQRSIGSLEKKRARDRRAQQNLRAKRMSHVKGLEEQLAETEAQLREADRLCETLRVENAMLRDREDAVRGLVASWRLPGPDGGEESSDGLVLTGPGAGKHGLSAPVATPLAASGGGGGGGGGGDDGAVFPPNSPALVSASDTLSQPNSIVPTPATTVSEHVEVVVQAGIAAPLPNERQPATRHQSLPPTMDISNAIIPYPSPVPHQPGTPVWKMTPMHAPGDIIVNGQFQTWMTRPELIEGSPESPHPLELLYGSKTNYLANLIHETVRAWPCRDPERLAGSWLTYHVLKWKMRPTAERYARLHAFQLPVAEQLTRAHPHYIDVLWWPQIRANMCVKVGTYDEAEVFGMYTCCIKVRWPWGKNFLEPDDAGSFRMCRDFYDTFTRIEGWGLTEEFFTKYPQLVEGMDMDSVCYKLV